MKKKTKAIVVTGPTATGKTSLGISLAREFDGEIISADSRQVYRGMDIGTGKDLEDYATGGPFVPYHLIDIVAPTEEYNLFRFYQDALASLGEIAAKGKLPFVVGGTALYINSLLRGYELPGGPPDEKQRDQLRSLSTKELAGLLQETYPDAYADLKDPDNRTRLLRAFEKVDAGIGAERCPEADFLVIGVYRHRRQVHQLIEKRLDDRLDSGMIDEVEQLHRSGVSWDRLEFLGLEYRYVSRYLRDVLSYDEMRDQLLAKIRKLAKAQDIWFRKIEKEGTCIHWLEDEKRFEQACNLVRNFLQGEPLPKPQIRISEIHYGPKSS